STCPGYPLTVCPPGWNSVNIPDNNANGISVDLFVSSDGENFITDVNAWFFIPHTYQGDLRVMLTSPAGTSVDLVNRPGSPGCGGYGYSAANFGYIDANLFLQEFELDDAAAVPYNAPSVPCPGVTNATGPYRPVSPLSA